MQSVVKIAKHLGSMGRNDELKGLKFDGDNVGVPNADGVYLHVSKDELRHYLKCPDDLLSDLVQAIGADQTLFIAEVDEEGNAIEEPIEFGNRHIFTSAGTDDQPETLFPDLIHGQYVELARSITRVNKIENTVGFAYEGHILTCKPFESAIATYLQGELFPNCIMKGIISRHTERNSIDSFRPKIVFSELMITHKENEDTGQVTLL